MARICFGDNMAGWNRRDSTSRCNLLLHTLILTRSRFCDNAELSSIFRRGNVDPESLDEEELFRFNLITRNYTNHIYKLYRLYEQGAFPEREWKNVVLEAIQLFEMPGMAPFKENNRYFADLWEEMGRHKPETFSSFDFGGKPRQ